MNLVTDPWLPVANSANEFVDISLKQLFEQPEEWKDLVLKPHERVSVMRLLICIVQAALDGPEDIDDWNDCLSDIPKRSLEYLEKWHSRFELFDPIRPFLQIGQLKPGNKTGDGPSVAKLDDVLAVGDNASTLFDHAACSAIRDHSIDRFVPASRLIISLITFLNYSPSGIQSSANLNGVIIKHNSGAVDAPCTNQNMLHTFVVKNTLLKTLHANLIDKEVARDFYENDWGKPVWELDEQNFLEAEPALNNSTSTYLGRLTPLSRFCKLTQGSPYFVYCKGFQYSTKPKKKTDSKVVYRDFLPEPSSTVTVNQHGEYALLKAGVNSPWRELSALVSMRSSQKLGGALPLRYLRKHESFDLVVLGQVRDAKNVAKILNVVESRLHVPPYMLQTASQISYTDRIRRCESRFRQLARAVDKYREIVDDEWKGMLRKAMEGKSSELERKRRIILHKKVTLIFWTLVEKQRYLLMTYISLLGTDMDIERERSLKIWNAAIEQAVQETYASFCQQQSPRQMRAFVAGWQILYPEKKSDRNKEIA